MLRELDDIGRETAVGAIRALEVELFGNHAWSEASIRQELDAPARVYVFDVDETDGRDTDREPAIRGFAGYWYDGDDAEIMDIGVSKTHQRQGIAVAMMNHLISHARRQGARRMLLEVSVVNDPAIALYHRFGFQRIGLRKRYYQPEGIDAYVMALDLEPRIVGFRGNGGAAGAAGDTSAAGDMTKQTGQETQP